MKMQYASQQQIFCGTNQTLCELPRLMWHVTRQLMSFVGQFQKSNALPRI